MTVKLHLGCGTNIFPPEEGWLNIDIVKATPQVFVHDLSKGLPPLTRVSYIYSSHFLEHLTDSEAVQLLESCRYVMDPGAKLRLCLPDVRVCVEAYLRGDWDFFSILDWDAFSHNSTRSLVDVVSYCVYQGGEHKSLWDKEKTLRVLEYVFGAGNAKIDVFDPSQDEAYEVRSRFSLYGEAWVQ